MNFFSAPLHSWSISLCLIEMGWCTSLLRTWVSRIWVLLLSSWMKDEYSGIYRCSYPEVFCKKFVLKIWQVHGEMPVLESLNKHHYQGFFLVTFQPFCHLNKQRRRHSCFPVGFAKFFKTTFLKNACERLSFVFWDMHCLISSFVLFRPAGQENSCFANVKLFPANLRDEEN